MRVFYLHLNRDDFNITGNGIFWQSDAIDLYYNSSYINFSLVRSQYGLGAIQPMMGGSTPNNVWVGMKYADSYPVNTDLYDDFDPYDSWEIYSGSTPNVPIVFTDSGFIIQNRFVDTSGPINLIDFKLNCPEYTSDVRLTTWQADTPSSVFPEEWTPTNTNITDVQGLYVNNAQRYMTFQLVWNYDPGDVDFYVRVEIGPPVMNPRYAETANILGKFPSWMAISELGDGNPNSATPALATNTSTGGKYINAISGEWLDDLRQQISYRQQQLFITSADLTQKCWIYQSTLPTKYPTDFEGDEADCVVASTQTELLQSQDSEDIVFWDGITSNVYSNKLYNSFEINGIQCPQQVRQVWNSFDDIGLLVNLKRLPLEGNLSFRSRILDVYINRPSAGLLGFQNALRRELNLWQFYGSTPDSYFIGATPTVLEITDILDDPYYMQPNGMPTNKMVRLVNWLAQRYPTTWGEFSWNGAFADLTDDNYTGYSVLPELMDATPWTDTQSGVGDLKDLVVYPPTNATGPRNFNVKFNIQGKAQQSNIYYAPLALNLTVTANGAKDTYNNPTTTVWLTLEFTQYSSATVSYYSFQLSSISDINNMLGSTPTPASVAALRVFDPDGGTNPNITLFDTTSGHSINSRLFTTDVSSVKLYPGQWVPGFGWENVPDPADYIAWFSNNASNTLHSGGPANLEIDNNAATPTTMPPITVLMQSTEVFHATDTWFSETIALSAKVNDSPTGVQAPAVVTLPNLNWDPYVASGQSLRVTIDNITVLKPDGTLTSLPIPGISIGTFTANLLSADGTTLATGALFPGNGFSFNLSNALNAASLEITLNSGIIANSIASYPISQNTTFYFTADQINSISGLVDENGPWIGGYAPASGNVNFLYGSYSFGLGDFNLPSFLFPTSNPIQTIVTSINVSNSGDDAVIVWLDNNTVTQSASNGRFGPFNLHVRVSPQPNPQWNPLVHGGTYFEGNQESYFYVDPVTYIENSAAQHISLPSPVQQGAPVLGFVGATPSPGAALRQVAFFSSVPPYNLTLQNTEVVTGSYTNQLYASYPNIIDVAVTDVTDPNNKASLHLTSTHVSDNIINVASPSFVTRGHQYQLQYQVADSFYVDNNYQGGWPPVYTDTEITSTPDYTEAPQAIVVTNSAATPKSFVYEGAPFQSSTPIDVALSPFYSTVEEGFIFLSNEDYAFDHAVLEFSSQIMNQDNDFIVVTLNSYDIYGNPKPNVVFTAALSHCHFGFDTSAQTITVTTNQYGYANFMVNSIGINNVSGQPVIDRLTLSTVGAGFYPYNEAMAFNAPVTFNGVSAVTYVLGQNIIVNPKYPTNPLILRGTAAQPSILSDGYNTQLVYGLLTNRANDAIPGATVNWVKGRTNFDLFSPYGQPAASGQVVTHSDGSFQVGPFYSDVVPGYWLMSLTAQGATPSVGDIVYWLEYPGPLQNIVDIVGLPDEVAQLATPVTAIPSYNAAWEHPVYYNNAEPVASATPHSTLNWIPPTWFPLPVFDQWEYNMFSATPGSIVDDWADYLYQNLPPNTDYEF